MLARASSALAGVSREQALVVAAFGVCVALNAAQSRPGALFPKSNADISNLHKTAFTPAGFAFGPIWASIYALAAAHVVWQALPAQRGWAAARSPWFARALMLNLVANGAWIAVFCNEALWASVAVIVAGLLLPLVFMYLSLDVGRGVGLVGPKRFLAPPQPASRGVTVTEFIVAHTFVSLYLGWVCVATIANVSITLTPRLPDAGAPSGDAPSLAGLSAPTWSLVMQATAFSLGVAALLLRGDAAFAVPIAWGLVAISSQQRSALFPGDDRVVAASSALGATLFALAGVAVLARTALLASGRTRFATAAEAAAADAGKGEAEGEASPPAAAVGGAEEAYASLMK